MGVRSDRKAYGEMLRWKEEMAPGRALFLEGARRVGKTTLAEKLGREQRESCIPVRFDRAEAAVRESRARARGRASPPATRSTSRSTAG